MKQLLKSTIQRLGYEVRRSPFPRDFGTDAAAYLLQCGVPSIRLVSESFSRDCPPLFPQPKNFGCLTTDELQLMVDDASFNQYFRLTKDVDDYFVTDQQT